VDNSALQDGYQLYHRKKFAWQIRTERNNTLQPLLDDVIFRPVPTPKIETLHQIKKND